MGDAWMREIATTVLCATHERLGNSFHDIGQYKCPPPSLRHWCGLLCVSNTFHVSHMKYVFEN